MKRDENVDEYVVAIHHAYTVRLIGAMDKIYS